MLPAVTWQTDEPPCHSFSTHAAVVPVFRCTGVPKFRRSEVKQAYIRTACVGIHSATRAREDAEKRV